MHVCGVWMRAAFGSTVLAVTVRSTLAFAQDAPPAAPPPPPAEPPKIEVPAPPLAPLPTGLVPPPEATPPPEPPPFEAPGLRESPADRARRSGQRTSDWDLLVSGYGGVNSISYLDPNTSTTSLHTGTAATISRYFAPLVDDDAPRSLQPFLQRESTLSLGFGLSGFSSTTKGGPAAVDIEKLTEIDLGPSIGANIYLTPAFALTAGFAYEYDVRSESDRMEAFEFVSKTHRLMPQAGFGIRFDDTRIDLSYRFEGDVASDREEQPPPAQWGSIVLGVETVIDRKVDLNFGGQVFDAGAGGSAAVNVYPTKDLALFGGGSGFAGRKYFNEDVSHNDYGGFVGAGLWFSPRVRGVFQYQLGGTTIPTQANSGHSSEVENEIDLKLLFRLP